MHDIAHYDEQELRKLRANLLLSIYYEFVYKQREFAKWQAGMETIQKIGT